jgi:hypothetical protein
MVSHASKTNCTTGMPRAECALHDPCSMSYPMLGMSAMAHPPAVVHSHTLAICKFPKSELRYNQAHPPSSFHFPLSNRSRTKHTAPRASGTLPCIEISGHVRSVQQHAAMAHASRSCTMPALTAITWLQPWKSCGNCSIAGQNCEGDELPKQLPNCTGTQ